MTPSTTLPSPKSRRYGVADGAERRGVGEPLGDAVGIGQRGPGLAGRCCRLDLEDDRRKVVGHGAILRPGSAFGDPWVGAVRGRRRPPRRGSSRRPRRRSARDRRPTCARGSRARARSRTCPRRSWPAPRRSPWSGCEPHRAAVRRVPGRRRRPRSPTGRRRSGSGPAVSPAAGKYRTAWATLRFASATSPLRSRRGPEHVQGPRLHGQVADLAEHREGLAELVDAVARDGRGSSGSSRGPTRRWPHRAGRRPLWNRSRACSI